MYKKFNLYSGEKKISDIKGELHNINKCMAILFNYLVIVFLSIVISIGIDVIIKYNIMNIREEVLYGYILLGMSIISLLISIYVCCKIIIEDIKENIKEFNYKNIILLCLILSLIQSIIVMFDIRKFLYKEVYLYNLLSLFVLFTYVLSLFINIFRIKFNLLAFLSKKDKKIVCKCTNNKNIIKRKYIEKLQICYSKSMDNMDVYNIEYKEKIYKTLFSRISLVILFVSIVLCAFLVVFYEFDIMSAISGIIIINSLTIPSIFLVIFSKMAQKLNKKLLNNGVIIFNYKDLKGISDVSSITIDAKDLYSPKYVEVKEMRVFKGNLLDEAIMYASSVSKILDTTLKFTFDDTISIRHRNIKKADKIDYIYNKGIVATIRGNRVLVGNGELLRKYGVSIPAKLYNTNKETDLVFIAINNDLIVMFYVYYKPHKYIGEYINRIAKEGIGISVKTCDPNVTPSKISKDFKVDLDMIEVLSEQEYDNYLKSGGSMNIFVDSKSSSMFRMIAASSKFKENRLLITIMQMIYIIVSVLIISAMMLVYKTCMVSEYDILLCNIIMAIVATIVIYIRK